MNGKQSSLWMETFTFKKVYPFDPIHSHLKIEDIAHGLALKCRYNGQCAFPYSIAQHSLHVARGLPKEIAIHGLLHDAAETYLPDYVRTIKPQVYYMIEREGGAGFEGAEEYEDFLLHEIYNQLRLPFPTEEEQKQVRLWDDKVLRAEFGVLFPQKLKDWDHTVIDSTPASIQVIERPWRAVEEEFLTQYKLFCRELTRV